MEIGFAHQFFGFKKGQFYLFSKKVKDLSSVLALEGVLALKTKILSL